MSHVKWVPCHHGMARLQIADGGDGLQIWRVAINISNKQSRTADRGWPSILGGGGLLGTRLNTVHLRTFNLLRNAESFGPGRIPWHDISTGKCT
jgi:hypothetical protein